ncbi:MAG: hypothetical protein HYZ44_14630 [Bacteroidetes bacterium]|nr:hypothetical protein [Bacteroidota bacterium]
MEWIENFYGYFNLFIGIIMTLIGFKVYRPFTREKEEEIYKKFGGLYKFGGIGLMIWGLIKTFK